MPRVKVTCDSCGHEFLSGDALPPSKSRCPECNGHGGTYDGVDHAGSPMGKQCETCGDKGNPMRMTDCEIVDWMEDNPARAIRLLEAEAKSPTHGLRERVRHANNNLPTPPTPPPTRMIRECDGPPLCNVCGSSLHKSGFLWLKTDGCIQPKCKNYHVRNKTTEGN